jgi:hypothetical protein
MHEDNYLGVHLEYYHRDISMVNPSYADGSCISLLDLPGEIRHQIYLYVLELHPRVDRELPGYPARHIARYVTEPIRPPLPSVAIASIATNYKPLPSSRPLCYMPHNLLRTCKQIYYEARLVPFQTNEFVFTEWMTSATSYCDAILRSMQPWQRQAIRHVCFAMGLGELSPGLSSTAKQADQTISDCQFGSVCAMLPGVRTMRMNLSCGVFHTEWFEQNVQTGELKMKEEWGERGRRWIHEGLARMGDLRVMEIECAFLTWLTPPTGSPDDKRKDDAMFALAWCKKVEEILNEGLSEKAGTRVVAVTDVRNSRADMSRGQPSHAGALALSYMSSGFGIEFSSSI